MSYKKNFLQNSVKRVAVPSFHSPQIQENNERKNAAFQIQSGRHGTEPLSRNIYRSLGVLVVTF